MCGCNGNNAGSGWPGTDDNSGSKKEKIEEVFYEKTGRKNVEFWLLVVSVFIGFLTLVRK